MSDCIHWHFMLSTEIINSIFTQLTDTGGIYVLPLCRDHLAFWVKAWNADRTLESSFARAHDRMDQLIVFANNMELNCDFVTLPVYEVHTAANTIGMVIVSIVCVCVWYSCHKTQKITPFSLWKLIYNFWNFNKCWYVSNTLLLFLLGSPMRRCARTRHFRRKKLSIRDYSVFFLLFIFVII